MFRDENKYDGDKNLFEDFSQEENQNKLDPYVDKFYDYTTELLKRLKELNYRNIPNIYSSLNTLHHYHDFFINLYQLFTHTLNFYKDTEFIRYECDGDKPIGILNRDSIGCDGVNLAKNNHKIEKSLEIVLILLFGKSITENIHNYPDAFRPGL
jgi:hypothetical protein